MGYDNPEQFPDIDTQQQTPDALPAVPVVVQGPVTVVQLPRRKGPAFLQALTSTMTHVLGPDPRRCRVTLICDQDWNYSTQRNGSGVPWYAKVPLVIEHADAVYASTSSAATLTVIPEYTGS